MIRKRLLPRGRLAALLALLLLCSAVPAAEYMQRLTVLFLASFEVAGAPSGTIVAEVGQFNPAWPPPTFDVVPGGNGNLLKISDNGSSATTVLEGNFKKTFDGTVLIATLRLQPLDYSGLVVQLEDSTDSGILDCSWGGGSIQINGAPTTLHYDANTIYDVTMRITKAPVGPVAWLVELRVGGLITGVAAGVLPLGAPPTIKSINLIRPGGEPAGTFYVDEMKVTSLDMLPY